MPLPDLTDARRLLIASAGQRAAIVTGVALGYIGTLPFTAQAFGEHALDLAAIPVAAIAAGFGVLAGGISGVVAATATALLLPAIGGPSAQGAAVPNLILMLGLGLSTGWARDLVERARWRAALLRTVVANAPIIIWATDADGRFTIREGAALGRIGMTPGEAVGEDARTFWRREIPEVPSLPDALERALGGDAVCGRAHVRARDFEYTMTPLRDPRGAVVGVVGVHVDLTQQAEAEREVTRGRARLDAIVSSARDAIITVDHRGRIVIFNAAAERMFGHRASDMLGGSVDRLIPERARSVHTAEIGRFLQDGGSGVHELDLSRPLYGVRATGEDFPIEATLSRVDIDGEAFATVIIRDVTERRRLDAQLERMALYDSLTELPNRTLFADRCELALAAARREGAAFAVLIADLDNFADVNVVHGTDGGDAALREIAGRLRSCVREVDMVARISGDNFALLLWETDVSGARDVSARVVEAVRAPFRIGMARIALSASIGISMWPDDGPDQRSLVAHAEIAMYRAKRDRRSVAVYETEDAGGLSVEDLGIAEDVRSAIDRDEIAVAFQPEVRSADGALVRMEALVRWTHPTLGPVAPDRLLRAAERAGSMRDLTHLVLERAVATAARWREGGHDVQIAVNLAATDLADPTLDAWISRLLARHHALPASLCLEVTETALVTDLERVVPRLAALRELGVAVAIDDFGTGYSSLSYLHRLPVSEVKVDRTFVNRMTTDAAAATIVRASIGLAHELGLAVVAEGVQTGEQLHLLRGMGCDMVQGFYVARPMAPGPALAWLAARRPTGVPGEAVTLATAGADRR